MRAAVVVFPGSNCDTDARHVLQAVLGVPTDMVWHAATELPGVDLVVLPGGFSHGDYLRTGAMAARAPIIGAVRDAAARGVPVLGICNGFQILVEAGLLPGALLRNADLAFHCQWVHVRIESTATPFTREAHVGQVMRLPIAHGEGNYFLAPDERARLEDAGQVVLRYCDEAGAVTPEANPNGSVAGIAGISDARGSVVGLMPHPERASEPELGSTDGRLLFEAALARVLA